MGNQNLSHHQLVYSLNTPIPKITLFNGKKIAEQLLAERSTVLQVVHDMRILELHSVQQSLNELDAKNQYFYEQSIKLEQHEAKLQERVRIVQEQLESHTKKLQDKIQDEENTLIAEDFGVYYFEHQAKDSVKLSDELKEVRRKIKKMVADKKAAKATSTFTFNNSKKEGQKFVDDMTKLMLRAYNAEAENAVKSVKSERSTSAYNRLERCLKQAERLGKMIDLEISPAYHQLRRREIELAFEHHAAVKIEKELAREEAERLREEKKAEAEIKRRKEELEKELRQKQIARQQIEERIKQESYTITPEEQEQFNQLVQEMGSIESSIEDVLERERNIKAGYVYVISNVGSFGEGCVKIGMTRRVDPMDRVKELGGASVPFGFDVHLLHYSENAVDVETKLHQAFAHKRVNLINKRREHFYVSPAEVKAEVLKLDGSVTTFNEDIDAEDYYESERIRRQLQQQEQQHTPTQAAPVKKTGRRAA